MILVNDLDLLRDKIGGNQEGLAAKWRHFETLAEHQAAKHPLYPAFVALVTGDAAAARRFRNLLEKMIDILPWHSRQNGWQHHTWCASAPIARWAIAYDWVADHPEMADFDHPRCADTLLDAVHSQALPRVHARVPICDNQLGSMLLACGVVGYLFGVKRGGDPRAARLYAIAMERISEITASAPAQFVGEGSTYMVGVNSLVMSLLYQFLEWLGKPCDSAMWKSCLQSGRNLISPGGLSLGWDAGGDLRAFNMAGLALLARATDDPAPLGVLETLDMWHGLDHCAWHEDTRLWTLLWWPETTRDTEIAELNACDRFPGWMHPDIGASLDVPERRMRLTQLWDLCGGGRVGGVGRPNTDPNALTVQIDESPILLDGGIDTTKRPFEFDPEVVLSPAELEALDRFAELRRFSAEPPSRKDIAQARRDLVAKFAHGCVGGANALVFNRQPWHYPRRDVQGTGTLYATLPRLQAVAADCTGHYAPEYPVTRVERTSLLLDDAIAVVLDRIDSDTELDAGWQAFVRPEHVESHDHAVTVKTPEGPGLQIVPENRTPTETEPVDGYPKPVGASVRVAWHKPVRNDLMATLLVLHEDTEIQDTTATWEGGYWRGSADAGFEPGEAPPQDVEWRTSGSLIEVVEALAAAPAAVWRVMRCRPSPPEHADYLRLAVHNPSAGLWCGKQAIFSPLKDIPPKQWARSLPFTIPVADLANHELIIATPSHCGRLQVDTGRWYKREPMPTATLTHENGIVTATVGGASYRIAPHANATHDIDTDARWSVRFPDGAVAVLDAAHARVEGAPPLQTDPPVHALWNREAWQTAPADLPPTIKPRPEQPLPYDDVRDDAPCVVPNMPGETVCDMLRTADADKLLAALDHEDWRVVRAAADRIGELGYRDAAPALRRLLEQEMRRDLYLPLGQEPSSGDWATDMKRIGTDIGNRRFRVLQASLFALHRLQDGEALPIVRRLLQTTHHFYPVYCAALDYMADFAQPEDRPILETWADYPETNSATRARQSLKCKV